MKIIPEWVWRLSRGEALMLGFVGTVWFCMVLGLGGWAVKALLQ